MKKRITIFSMIVVFVGIGLGYYFGIAKPLEMATWECAEILVKLIVATIHYRFGVS